MEFSGRSSGEPVADQNISYRFLPWEEEQLLTLFQKRKGRGLSEFKPSGDGEGVDVTFYFTTTGTLTTEMHLAEVGVRICCAGG